jgi:hypothetical protein
MGEEGARPKAGAYKPLHPQYPRWHTRGLSVRIVANPTRQETPSAVTKVVRLSFQNLSRCRPKSARWIPFLSVLQQRVLSRDGCHALTEVS